MDTTAQLDSLFTINDLAWTLYNSNPVNKEKRNMSPKEITLLLQNLKKQNVQYILIGGFAMAFHGFPRATGDINLWIKNTPENMDSLKVALIDTGIPEAQALRSTTQLVAGFSIFNLLDSDFKIDLLHNLKSFKEKDFDKCFKKSGIADYNGVSINVLDANDFLIEKQAVNRPKDLVDINYLKQFLKKITKRKDEG